MKMGLSELEEERMKLSCPMKRDTPPFFEGTTEFSCSSVRTLRSSSNHKQDKEEILDLESERAKEVRKI